MQQTPDVVCKTQVIYCLALERTSLLILVLTINKARNQQTWKADLSFLILSDREGPEL